MFKNLKEKVKQSSSTDLYSIVQKTTQVKHSRQKSIASNNNDETKSNGSSKITDDLQTNFTQSSSDIGNYSIKFDNETKSASDEQINEDEGFKMLTMGEIELTKEKNEHLVEKIKFQKFNDSLLNKIEILNVKF